MPLVPAAASSTNLNASVVNHSRNHAMGHTITSTKVLATFSTKSTKQGVVASTTFKNKTNTLLSQSIKESMAKCSPTRASNT